MQVRLRLALAAALACLGSSPALAAAVPMDAAAMAQSASAVAYTVTGILGYARWPELSAAPIRLCILGSVAHGDVLAGLSGEQPLSNGRPVITRSLALHSPNIAAHCDAIYTGHLDAASRQALYERIAERAVLSISEDAGDCTIGPMFCLLVHGPSVSFRVNLDAVARSGVRIHPRVLKLGYGRAGQP